ncbi:TrbI/VirB10 family protein [Luteibacter sp.]|jgi:type IV secretion system protein VirB10|uniref:TrbI/VirB10 family protein n=1 Tax=Luteibacter sp. TaxID=1886636 RepID=UPI002F3E766C
MSGMDGQRTGIDSLAPDTDLSTKTGDAPTGVRRVNNMPLLLIGGVLVVFVILVALVAVQRGERKHSDPAPTTGPLPENSQLLDQMLANSATGGLIPDPDEAHVPSFPVARVDDPDAPPLPGSSAGNRPQADDAMAKERMKLFQTAMHAKTGVGQAVSKDAAAGKKVDRNDEEDDIDRQGSGASLEQLRPIVADGNYANFDRKKAAQDGYDRWRLESDVEAPRTSYEVRAGAVIPATMISGINSELPGQIVAQVSQDVFDTPTGRHRLIPQGSKLVGRYNHNIVHGQSRVLVAWQRIVFPDGKALDIGAMEGADSAGYAGFGDRVDRHYLRLFGSAMLMSGIISGLTSSRVDPGNDPFGSSNAAQLSQNLAQQLGEVATKMIEKNMNIAPTIEIRPGYRFNVMAVKDLTFEKPYRAFDY